MTSKKNNEHIEPENKQDTQPVVVENEKADSTETTQPEQKLDASASNTAQNKQPQAEHKEQIEKAEKITDASLSALVVADLKTKQTYRDQEELDAYADADNEAQTLVTNNNLVSLDQIPKDVYNKMSPGKQEELKQYFIGEERDAVLMTLAALNSEKITVTMPDISASLVWLKEKGEQ